MGSWVPGNPYYDAWVSQLPHYGYGNAPVPAFRPDASFVPTARPEQRSLYTSVSDEVKKVTRPISEVLNYALKPVGLAKEGIDELFRASARDVFGLNVPDDLTAGQALTNLILPPKREWGNVGYTPTAWAKQTALGLAEAAGVPQEVLDKLREQPSIDEFLTQAGQRVEEAVAPEDSIRRGLARGVVGFGSEMALDPMVYALGGLMRGARGSRVAREVLGPGGVPGVRAYAPEVAQALEEATKVPGVTRSTARLIESAGMDPEQFMRVVTPLRRAGERLLHYGFAGQMATGGVSAIDDAIRRGIDEGKISQQAVEQAVQGALGLGMAGAMALGMRSEARSKRLEAETAARVRPGMRYHEGAWQPLPIDRVPDPFQPQAENQARRVAQAILSDGEEGGRKAMGELPEELQPHAQPIWEQATEEANSIRGGRDFLERVRQEHGPGPKGVTEEPGPDGDPRLIQRDEAGKIVAAAQLRPGRNAVGRPVQELGLVAGGRALGSAESAAPLLKRLDDMGVVRGTHTTVLGAMARRRGAERYFPREVLEGRERPPRPAEVAAARREAEQAGLADILAIPRLPGQAPQEPVPLERPEVRPAEAAATAPPEPVPAYAAEVKVPRYSYQKGFKAEDIDSIPTSVLSMMNRKLKARGYDMRGPEDVRESIRRKGGRLTPADWHTAFEESVASVQGRAAKAASTKEATPHVSWDVVRGLGTTSNPVSAGFIRPDGKLLDLSGPEGGPRGEDHRIVGGTAGMQELVSNAGYVRWMPEANGLDIGKEPTPQQYRQIQELAQRADGEMIVDLEEGLGQFDPRNEYYTNGPRKTSLEYPKGTRPSKIAGDIRRFYAGEELQSGPRYATEAGPGFYSQLRRVVESPKTQATQRGGDWLKFLQDPKRQVKADELKWTGLDDYLKSRSGERVSREDIQRYLDQNEVRVEEVARGEAPKVNMAEYIGAPATARPGPDGWEVYDVQGRKHSLQYAGTPEAALAKARESGPTNFGLDEIPKVEAPEPTKFSQYTLPGGENYREVLLTLPQRAPDTTGWKVEKVLEKNPINGNPDFKVTKPDGTWTIQHSARTPEEAIAAASGFERLNKGTFRGGHFEEPNVLAHVRLDDRTGPNGEKVLFVEEIQSDWAQKGRREGFALRSEETAPLDSEYRALVHKNAAAREAGREPDPADVARAQELEALLIRSDSSKIPQAPFVGKTEDWTNLALKRILRYASENGYDKVAWTTGEQQAERYDLSKQLDSVRVSKAANDDGYVVAGEKDGVDVYGSGVVPREKLADYIGKDLAEKALAKLDDLASKPGGEEYRGATFSGLDLKVGGEGMKGFYDEIVPAAARKLAKKWGAQVGKTALPETQERRYVGPELSEERLREARQEAESEGDIYAPRQLNAAETVFPREGAAGAARLIQSDVAAKLLGGKMEAVPGTGEVHSIDITPQMRESVVKEGFPLFAREEAGAAKPTEKPAPEMRETLLKLYPENSIIREEGNRYEVTLPDKRKVVWRVGKDAIKLDLGAFEKGYERKPVPGERAVGATYRLPNSALVEIVEGASPRVPLHEHWHVLKHLGQLTERQQRALDKRFGGNEEKEADAFAKWMQRKPANTIFEKIWQAVRSLYEQVTGAPEAVFEQAVRGALAAREAGPPRLSGAEPPPGTAEGYAVQPLPEGEPIAPPPEAQPSMGGPKPPNQPPRVETRVENFDEAVAEQNKLGIPAKGKLDLSREHRRNWEAIDPEIRKIIADWDDDRMIQTMQRRRLSDAETMALDAVVRGRREAKELARLEYMAAKGGPKENEAFSKYARALGDYVPLERANINDGSGTARALAARARLMEAAQTADRRFLKKAMRELPGIGEADAQRLVQMFETGDPRLSDAIRAATAGRWKQWQTLLRAFLITPSSEIPNLIGNTIVQGLEVADSAVSSGLDWAVSRIRGNQRERYLGELGAEASGWMDAAPAAVLEFLKQRFAGIYKRAWTGESQPINLNTRLEYQVSPFKSKLPRLIATSLDALAAGDQLFRAPLARGELKKRAYRLAAKELGKRSGPEVMRRTEEIAFDVMQHPDKYGDLLQQIQSNVSRRLFQDKPWKMVDHLRAMEKDWPWMAAVLPFVKTPANIARYGIHHSPLGFLTADALRAIKVLAEGKPLEREVNGRNVVMDQGEATDILAQRLVGTAVFASALALAKTGRLTGGGPADPKERNALRETGWQPYSIVADVAGQRFYIPISRFDPVSEMMGVAADVNELGQTRDAKDAASKVIGSIGENFTDRTYLKGLIDFTEAANDPMRFAGNYAIGIATMHVPRQIARIAQAIDPVLRDVRPVDKGIGGWPERLKNELVRSIPWLSTTLPPRYGPTGEEIVRPGEGAAGAAMRAFSPIQVSAQRPGRELEGLMAQIGYVPGEPKPYITVQGKQIQLEPRDLALLHQADRAAAHEIRRLMQNPLFQRLPDTVEEGGSRSKEGIIRDTYSKMRDLARQRMFQSLSFRRHAREQLRAQT